MSLADLKTGESGVIVRVNSHGGFRKRLIEMGFIRVALVGNPNCGKTSLFNIASGGNEHVGNYSGVTVDAKEGHFSHNGYDITLVNLPGTYSLSAYSPEELYVRKNLIDAMPDVIVNVVDASNIERNLYLTTQLIDMNLRTVVALNMYDELKGFLLSDAENSSNLYIIVNQRYSKIDVSSLSPNCPRNLEGDK